VAKQFGKERNQTAQFTRADGNKTGSEISEQDRFVSRGFVQSTILSKESTATKESTLTKEMTEPSTTAPNE
jgi:hypothetical protein